MPVRDPDDLPLEDLAGICRHLPNFLDKGTWRPQTRLEDIVLHTLVRSRGTFEVIIQLATTNRTLQAAMLGRSLFEDMVVVHWLVLHDDDPDWLLERFDGHARAMRLYEAELREQMGWPANDDVPSLRADREGLVSEFGSHAERDWWGRDATSARITMPRLVERLSASPRFHPRLRGEQPVLEQYYRLQHKAWTQALHHTAAGMEVQAPGEDGFPASVARVPPAIILFGNYWVFGQTIWAALDLAARDVVPYFEKLFLTGIAAFGEALGLPLPSWAADVESWVDELE